MLFGNDEESETGEVRISANEPKNEDEKTKLEEEAEDKLVEDSGSLPGVGTSGGSSSVENTSVDVDDLHSQNEKIIGLLEDIKSEISGGGDNQLL